MNKIATFLLCFAIGSIFFLISFTIQKKTVEVSDFTTYTDTETGCQYIVSKTGMTVRLGSDGFPLCGDRVEKL